MDISREIALTAILVVLGLSFFMLFANNPQVAAGMEKKQLEKGLSLLASDEQNSFATAAPTGDNRVVVILPSGNTRAEIIDSVNLLKGINTVTINKSSNEVDLSSIQVDKGTVVSIDSTGGETTASDLSCASISSSAASSTPCGGSQKYPLAIVYVGNKSYTGRLVSEYDPIKLQVGDITYLFKTYDYLIKNQSEVKDVASTGEEITVKVYSEEDTTAKLSYLTAGSSYYGYGYSTAAFSWDAQYALALPESGNDARLAGNVKITNNYEDVAGAYFKLISGNVPTASGSGYSKDYAYMMESAALPSAYGGSTATSSGDVFEFKLFELRNPVSIREGQQKAVGFLDSHVRYKKEYVATSSSGYYSYYQSVNSKETTNPAILLTIVNSEANGLGVPLPAGTVKLYTNANGHSIYIGDVALGDVSTGENISLSAGSAYDITSEKTLVAQDSTICLDKQSSSTDGYKVEIRNHKSEAVVVKVLENLGQNAKVKDESQQHESISANTVAWYVDVPADGTATLTYTLKQINNC